MARRRSNAQGASYAVLFFLSLSVHLAVMLVFGHLMELRDATWTAPSPDPIRIALVDEPVKSPEGPKERLVKNHRIVDERPPEQTRQISEFDNRVEKETQAPTVPATPGRARVTGSGQRPSTQPAKSPTQPAEASAQPQTRAALQSPADATDAPRLTERDYESGYAPARPQSGNAGEARKAAQELRSDADALRSLFGTPGSYDRVEGVEEGEENLFNSRRSRYASFFNRVRDAVAQRWHPEEVHKKRDPYGKIYGEQPRRTTLRVLLNPDGSLHRVYTDGGSGVQHLDEEAVRAMRRAAPFVNPPPGLVSRDTGKIEFTFQFVLLFDGTKQIFRYRR